MKTPEEWVEQFLTEMSDLPNHNGQPLFADIIRRAMKQARCKAIEECACVVLEAEESCSPTLAFKIRALLEKNGEAK